MHPYIYELHAQERLAQLREEGQRSQAVHRSLRPTRGITRRWPGFLAVAASILVLMLVWAL